MKISICIPQYNRIQFLIKSLRLIEAQSYTDIEVVISDDCSTDNTVEEINRISKSYRYPIIFHRNEKNLGYDANYRQSILLSSGDYCIVIGNDDSIYGKDSISNLVDFIQANDYPEIGFANFVEAYETDKVIERAKSTTVVGSGVDVALKYYGGFSFVGGLIYNREKFIQFQNDKHDGSIYIQMYIGCLMIASGCRLFTISEPIIIKDLELEHQNRKSYKDTIARDWKDHKIVDGGLPSVIHVLISAFRDAGALNQRSVYLIFRRIYSITFPHWILDYKSHDALPEAIGLVRGLNPSRNPNINLLNGINKARISGYYYLFSVSSLLFPSSLFLQLKSRLYRFFKK